MPSRTQAPTQPSDPRAPEAVPPPTPPVSRRPPRKTLWEEGTHPGALVIRAAVIAVLAVTLVSLLLGNRLGVLFDVVFVVVCVGSALWVRPRDFFGIGVLPPLLLGFVVVLLAVLDRGAIAKAQDPFVQAVVSGLAHHAIALAVGYSLTLLVLALRQVALRNRGTLRPRRSSSR